MRSNFFSQLLRVLGMLLLLVLILLLGWFLPDLPGLFADSSPRRKPMSAEAKFLWLVFVILSVIGFTGWWMWGRMRAQ